MEGAWSRILDADQSPEVLAKELTSEFLDFVRDEAAALDAGTRTKVLISFLYLKDEQLESLDAAISRLCQSCETDAEEWVRVISGIVLRWLKKVPKTRDDAFLKEVKLIYQAVLAAQQKSEGGNKARFSLPLDALPTHWPFLSRTSLPSNFDVEASLKNTHFIASKDRTKRIKTQSQPSVPSKVTQPMSPQSIPVKTSAERPPSTSPPALPEKIQQLLQDAPFLTPENRQVINKFFSSTTTSELAKETEIKITETKQPSETRPGQIQITESFVRLRLDQDLKKIWNIVRRVKHLPQSSE